MLAGMYLLAPPVVDDDYTAPEYLEVVGIGYVTDCELWRGCKGVPIFVLTSRCDTGTFILTSAYIAYYSPKFRNTLRHTLKPPLGERRLDPNSIFDMMWTNARYMAYYLRPLSEKYGASAYSIFEPLRLPGGGALVGFHVFCTPEVARAAGCRPGEIQGYEDSANYYEIERGDLETLCWPACTY
jgi:hypothetical protein